jgi:hypothetical protein
MKTYLVGLLLSALIPAVAGAAEIQAFKPGNPTVIVAATTTSTSVALPGNGGSLLIFNACCRSARAQAVTPHRLYAAPARAFNHVPAPVAKVPWLLSDDDQAPVFFAYFENSFWHDHAASRAG